MGTTAQKLNRVLQTKSNLKTVINYSGANITNETTFKDYPKLLNKAYIDILNDEGESLYNALPKTTGTGTSIDLDVEKGKMKIKLKGNTYQNTSILPSEYTQVDYIESSGTQYIDSGILPSENIGFEIDFTSHNDLDSTSSARTIFGSRTNYKTNGYQLTTYTTSSLNGGHFLFGTDNTASNIRHSAYMQKDVRCQISFLNGVFKDANGNQTNIQGTFSNVNKNIYLFGCLEGTLFELSTTTLYKLKFYDNGNLVRDFIPCYRNSDNVVGLYDLVNNVFYTNQGTGAFTYGSVVNIPNPDYPQDIEVVTGEQNIEIVGKNLFDTSNLSSQTKVGVTTTFDNSKITFNGASTGGVIFAKSDLGYKLKAGTYTFHFEDISGNYQNPNSKDLAIFLTNSSSDTAFGNVNLRRTRPYITFTITEDTEIYLYMYINGTITFDNWTIGFQIEKGSTATEYVEHQEQNYHIDLGNLEYCKIGDYADQFFKNTTDSEFYDSTLELNEWYLKKSIGKYIFTGNENLISYGTVGGYSIDNIINAYSTPNTSYPVGKCTISEMIRRISIYDGSLEGISYNNTQIFLRYANKTQEEILSLLANNELYYVLATPQYIHISQTDYPTLKTQLDNLYNNAKSYEGITHITQTNDDLPFNLELSALAKIE